MERQSRQQQKTVYSQNEQTHSTYGRRRLKMFEIKKNEAR